MIALVSHDHHAHMHSAHSHGHGHGHAHPAPADYGRAFAIGIGLNLAYVVIEAGYGVFAGSLALWIASTALASLPMTRGMIVSSRHATMVRMPGRNRNR